jgi:hypothetical protein
MTDKQINFLKVVRQALLMVVDGIEDLLEMERTAEVRKRLKTVTFELDELKKESCKAAEV